MGRVTRYPPKPKIEYLHEVTVTKWELDRPWIWEDATRIGGITGYIGHPVDLQMCLPPP